MTAPETMKISDTVVGEADPLRASRINPAAIRVGAPTNQRSWRPPEKADDDEALKWICAVGEHRDKEAFAALFNRYAPKVKSYLIQRAIGEPTAEEMAERALLAMWREAPLFPGHPTTAAGWIFRLTVREIVANQQL